jgi:hypothetical protein
MEFQTPEGRFVATCSELSDGTWSAVLTGHSPAGFVPKPPSQPVTQMKRFAEEHLTRTTLLEVIEACRQRVGELGGEILDEIPRDES